jgi:coproporphyrinogen III oxidase-like Fe-S oxidoreductase
MLSDPVAVALSVAEILERRLRLQRFIEGVEHMKRHDLRFEVQLIYGLPGETPATFRKSLNFAYSLDAGYLEVFRLMILPGTELWRRPRVRHRVLRGARHSAGVLRRVLVARIRARVIARQLKT